MLYEYKAGSIFVDELESELKVLGAEGWRLVQSHAGYGEFPDDLKKNFRPAILCIFERVLEPTIKVHIDGKVIEESVLAGKTPDQQVTPSTIQRNDVPTVPPSTYQPDAIGRRLSDGTRIA